MSPATTYPSWTDLETRFRGLLPAMKWYRLDYQWGAAGEHWYLQGGVRNGSTSEFETLATIAGDLLISLPTAAVAPEALSETKARNRWYLALWHHMTNQVPNHIAFENGKKEPTIYGGTIREPVQLSATLCLQFSTLPARPPQVGRIQGMWMRLKGTTAGRLVWWFGEEPLKKALGAAVVAVSVWVIPPIRHGVAALIRWIASFFR